MNNQHVHDTGHSHAQKLIIIFHPIYFEHPKFISTEDNTMTGNHEFLTGYQQIQSKSPKLPVAEDSLCKVGNISFRYFSL